MSLYSDLNEVLTPYAQRIKGLVQADTELKADLDDVNESLSDVRDDLSGLDLSVVDGKLCITYSE